MYRDKVKNFYYDIKVSTPDGKRTARLTDTLMKLCVKADILEAIASEDQGGASSLNLTFVEADFLPDSLNKTPAEGVDGRGYITNRTGALIDLRFDSEKGFTYVTQEELQSGITKSSRTQSGETEPVKFMFSANNEIEITWGLLEPKTSRTRKFRIGVVNYSTGAGGASLSLQCYDLQKDLARLKLSEGKVWLDKEGNPQSLKQILFSICVVFGARLDFDEDIVTERPTAIPNNYVLERTERGGDTKVSSNNNPMTLVRNQTIDGWIKELTGEFNSVYEIYDDPIDGRPVIKFTSKTLRYKKVVKTLNYRDPNGIMLEFQFNSIAGEANKETSTSAVDENGEASKDTYTTKLVEIDNQSSKDNPNRTAKQSNTYDPIPLIYNKRARVELERDLFGVSFTLADTAESEIVSKAEVSCLENSFMGFITVKTMGHPDLKPDVMRIEGVGVRASTTYRFFQVQHSLSASGYTCSMQGKTQKTNEEGTSNQEQLKKNEDYVIRRLQVNDN